jgi:hypothetical protein
LSRLPVSQSGKKAQVIFHYNLDHNTDVVGYTNPFNYYDFVSASLEPYNSWADLYDGPSGKGDNFTQILRYNLSDPSLTATSAFGNGITMTGYGDRSNFTTQPFAAEDIIIVSDGLCGSTCALFVEFMSIQAGVKVVALGGRPQNGPMQPVGGTKGSRLLTADNLNTFSEYLISSSEFGSSDRREWTSILPGPFPIIAGDATINFLDNIRDGDDGMTPTHFTNETANCRLWYTPEMVSDILVVWNMVADAAWGGADGGIDEGKCVPGSYRTASLLEEPPVAPKAAGSATGSNTSKGSGDGEGGQTNAAAKVLDVRWPSVAVWWVFVVSIVFL